MEKVIITALNKKGYEVKSFYFKTKYPINKDTLNVLYSTLFIKKGYIPQNIFEDDMTKNMNLIDYFKKYHPQIKIETFPMDGRKKYARQLNHFAWTAPFIIKEYYVK